MVIKGLDTLDMPSEPGTDLVFLGSSRCYAHFDPLLFERQLPVKAVNIGVDGHSELTMQMLRLMNYLAKNKAPRSAILSFDPLVSAGSVDDNPNMVNKNEFARYAFWPTAANEPIVRYFKFDWTEKYVPLYAFLRYKLFPDCITLPNDKEWRTKRYNRHDENWDTLSHPAGDTSIMRAFFDTSAANMSRIETNLRSIDSLCKQHNTRLICVQTPVYRSIYRESYFARTGQICSRLNISFFDLSSGPIKEDISNFYNSDHLNTKGISQMTAELFSRPAFRQLLSPTRKD